MLNSVILNGVKNLDFSRQVLVWQEILRFTQNDRSTRHKGFTPRIRVELFLYFLTAENAEYTEINSNFVVFISLRYSSLRSPRTLRWIQLFSNTTRFWVKKVGLMFFVDFSLPHHSQPFSCRLLTHYTAQIFFIDIHRDICYSSNCLSSILILRFQ